MVKCGVIVLFVNTSSSPQALDPVDAGGRILGYQVSYRPVTEQQLQDRFIQNVTEGVVALEVEEGNWSVTVTAFNMAGYGPSANLSIDTQRRNCKWHNDYHIYTGCISYNYWL